MHIFNVCVCLCVGVCVSAYGLESYHGDFTCDHLREANILQSSVNISTKNNLKI